MSMTKCAICDTVYDTDFEMETDELGDCICDECFEENAEQCDCCGEDKVCRNTTYQGGDITVCHECSD